jgi:hypothetical protein
MDIAAARGPWCLLLQEVCQNGANFKRLFYIDFLLNALVIVHQYSAYRRQRAPLWCDVPGGLYAAWACRAWTTLFPEKPLYFAPLNSPKIPQ